MKKNYLFGLMTLLLLGSSAKMKAQDEPAKIQHKLVLEYSNEANVKVGIYFTLTDEANGKILVDWGEGKAPEEVAVAAYTATEHEYAEAATGKRLVTIDATNLKGLRMGYRGIAFPIGLQEFDAPVLESLMLQSSPLTETPNLDLSSLKSLKEVALQNVETFVAPASLESLDMNKSYDSQSFVKSVDVTKATHLKKLILSSSYSNFHNLSSLDLTNNTELEVLKINRSKHGQDLPKLAEIKGIKNLHHLKDCDVSYLALDFANLPVKQADENAVNYANQQPIIPKDKVSGMVVDLAYLMSVNDGMVDGTHASEVEWFIAPKALYGDPVKIEESKYDAKDGVYTFHKDVVPEGEQSVNVCFMIKNGAYPNYGEKCSQPIQLQLVDLNHVLTFGTEGVYADIAKVSFDVQKQHKDGDKWVSDGNVNSGDKVEPGTHLSINAKWEGDDYIIRQWFVNGEVLMHTPKKGNPFISQFNPIYMDMPQEGQLNIKVELNRANLIWSYITPEGAPKKGFSLEVTKEDGTKLFGQRMNSGKMGYYLFSPNPVKIIYKAKAPKGYRVKSWIKEAKLLQEGGDTYEYTMEKASEKVAINVEFEKIPEDVAVTFTANVPDVATLKILTGDTAEGATTEVQSGAKVAAGKFVKLSYTITEQNVTFVELKINGAKQEAATAEGLAAFALTADKIANGKMEAELVLQDTRGTMVLANGTMLKATEGGLILRAEVGTVYAVYSVEGNRLALGTLSASEQMIPLNAGVYLVRVNDKTYKVMIK